MKEKNQVRSRTFNYCVSQRRAQIESFVIYCKNISKKYNNISLEEILSLFPRFRFIREHYFGWVMIQIPI